MIPDFHYYLRILSHLSVELLLDQFVVGTHGDGGKVNVPDGIAGALDSGDGRGGLPLVDDGDHEERTDGDGQDHQNYPQSS